MAFNPALVNFLTVGDFTDTSYGMPLSQPLVAAASSGLIFANAGGGGLYTLGVNGNLAALMTLQTTTSYGIMISVPQVDGGVITRQLATNSTISLTHAAGQAGNPTLSVVPSSSLQLTAMQVGGSSTGASHSTLNLIAGTNVGITAVDTGTKTNVTINATIASGILAAPVVTYTASSDFTADQNIGLLTTGLLKNTVSGASGTLSTAVSGTDYLAPTATLTEIGALSPTNGDLLYYTGSAWSLLSPGTTGYFLKTTGATAVAWAVAGDVLLAGTNAFTGTNTFNSSLPTSTVTPTTSTQLVTKAYADSIVGGAPLGATYLTTTANATLTNESNLGALATGLVLSTVSAGTATISTLPAETFVDVTTAQTVAGIKTFSSAPVMSGASITSATIPAAAVSGTAGTLSGTNAWTGSNTFNTSLPTSSVTPSGASDLVTKTYVDSTFAPVTTYATVTTTDATPTTLATISAPAFDAVLTLTATVNGRRGSSNFESVGSTIMASAFWDNGGGVLSMMGAPYVILQTGSTATVNAVIVGNTMVIQVTGIAATTFVWSTNYTVKTN